MGCHAADGATFSLAIASTLRGSDFGWLHCSTPGFWSLPMKNKYTMTISRLTVEKLGVKLYDRVSAVIAELIANSYDADATLVEVAAPLGQLLATKSGGKLQDKGYTIVVKDHGIGMSPRRSMTST